MPADEYPTLPTSPEGSGSIDGTLFTQAVQQVQIAADRGDTLPILTGVRVEIEGERVTLLATDRYRLAMRELTWSPNSSDASHVALIPARTLSDTAKALGASGSVEVSLGAAAGGSGNGLIDYVKQTQCLKAAQLPKGVTFKSDNFKNVKKSAAYTKACAGNTRPMFFIGVDSNQNYLGDFDKNPATLNHGLTSMTKRVDNAVYALISDVKANKFKGGERRFGLKDNGVGYAVDSYNKALISSAQIARLEAVKAKIISGAVATTSRRSRPTPRRWRRSRSRRSSASTTRT